MSKHYKRKYGLNVLLYTGCVKTGIQTSHNENENIATMCFKTTNNYLRTMNH